jgi:Flp pilus assembly protein TadB
MTVAALAAAAAASLAAWLGVRGPTSVLAPSVPTEATGTTGRGRAVQDERALLLRLRPLLVPLVVLAGWSVLGGVPGIVAGVLGAAVTWRVLGRTESPAVRRRRDRLRRDLPTAVDLLASVLASGSSLDRALAVVARAVGGPVGEELAAIGHRLQLGIDPPTVWRAVSHDAVLGPFGRAALRAHESGASVAVAVRRLGAELRARERTEVETRAKSVEVRAAAPLGACFLPAFVLLGVVPMVAGLFSSLRLF